MTVPAIPVTAIVLAAGKSSRMGRSKPLLPIGGMPMLEITLRKLAAFPFAEILCITGYMNEAVQNTIQMSDSRFSWVFNPHYAEGQSTSLKLAAKSCRAAAQGILVFLADQPFIEPSTIEKMLSEAERTQADHARSVVQPVYQGQKGHPVYFSKRMLTLFAEMDGDTGAKNIIRRADRHQLVPVEDEGVIVDLDTMEDYEKYKQRQPPK